MNKIRIGVSRCLLGDPVRYDGAHRRDRYVADVLGEHFDWVPVCPEVEVGLPVPRPTIRLVRVAGSVRVLGSHDPSLDVTEALGGLYDDSADRFADISGFILKRGSPSCGSGRVKVYDQAGRRAALGTGAFARALQEGRPTLPLEDEIRLNDPALRESFITRVFAFRRWQDLCAGPVDVAAFERFNARHKLLLMAHNQAGYRRLRLRVAATRPENLPSMMRAYERGFMETLGRKATARGHSNVLHHLAGYLARRIDGEDQAELSQAIARYREGELPRLVPLTLLRHHFARHPHPWVAEQVYLEPHPEEVLLQNRV